MPLAVAINQNELFSSLCVVTSDVIPSSHSPVVFHRTLSTAHSSESCEHHNLMLRLIVWGLFAGHGGEVGGRTRRLVHRKADRGRNQGQA